MIPPICSCDTGICGESCPVHGSIGRLAWEKKQECLTCFKSDILLRMALTAARGRLLNITNKEHDEVFDRIEKYLREEYPEGSWEGGCPSLD